MATLTGTAGSDSLIGGADPDLITGDAGNDTLNGGAGSDSVDGGTGADLLIWDQDTASSGSADTYHGGTGSEGFDPSPYSQNGGDTLYLGSAGAGTTGVTLMFTTDAYTG